MATLYKMAPLRTKFFYNILFLIVFSIVLYIISTQILSGSDQSTKYNAASSSITPVRDNRIDLTDNGGNDAKEEIDDSVDWDSKKVETKSETYFPNNYMESRKAEDAKSQENLEDEKPNWYKLFSETAQKVYQMFSPNLEHFRKWALAKERQFLEAEMRGYKFADSDMKLEDLILEIGGEPLRSAIFTTWRSGSTFLGEALNTNPGTFYHYEPLLHFDIVQVRDGSLANEANRTLTELMNCRYQDLEHYINYGNTHHWLYNHNSRLWQFCEKNHQVCSSAQFLSEMCKMFPFQAIKTVRMRLKLAQPYLDNEKLKFRVLLLVRDPRGTMQSRQHRSWCPGNPDCDDPKMLCKDLEDDYYTAQIFRQMYPTKFLVMRYEDLSLNSELAVRKIFKFFHLQFHPQVQKFLETHTTRNTTGVSSTFRDSKVVPFHWRDDFLHDFSTVEKIQSACQKAMQLWGYVPTTNVSHMAKFTPISSPPWPEMKPDS